MRKPNYYIDKKLKVPDSFFDWCYSQIETYKWSNKTETILASDRSNCEVVEKRLTKRTNLDLPEKFYPFAIILVTSKRIEIQSYGFWAEVRNGKQFITHRLTNFELLANDEHIKITADYNNRFWYGLTPNFGGMSGGAYYRTQFYKNDWKRRIRIQSELKYLNLYDFKHSDLSHLYKYRTEIEFLQKINATKLAEQVMFGDSVDMRTINDKWLKENKHFFKNSDRSFREFELERRIKNRRGQVVPGIESYLSFHDINKIPKGIGIVRFQNWIIKNKIKFKYYQDYIEMLKDLNLDPTGNENLIIPKNLEKAHDNAVNLLNQLAEERIKLENDKKQKEYQEILNKRLKLEAEMDDYRFVIPRKLNELIIEGKELHHCVGGSAYIDKHKTGKTTIVFVRKKEMPDLPFFTLELKDGEITQLRGKHNIAAPVEVRTAADHWLDWTKEKEVA